jgi:hypothetical protein
MYCVLDETRGSISTSPTFSNPTYAHDDLPRKSEEFLMTDEDLHYHNVHRAER